MGGEDDEREVELETLCAIFPEINRVDDGQNIIFSLDIAVSPATAVTVTFATQSESVAAILDHGSRGEDATSVADGHVEEAPLHKVAHLPPVNLRVTLPPTYPAAEAPGVIIASTPRWLPLARTKTLQSEVARLWEEAGQQPCVYDFIDLVQQSAENLFDLADSNGILGLPPESQISILDYNIRAERIAFEKQTFVCGVCLDPKKGLHSYRMIGCGHVFCRECLQDYYNTAITQGIINNIRCLDPECEHDRRLGHSMLEKVPGKPMLAVSPSELLQIPLTPEMVRRYVTLKYKNEIEADQNTVYCPRSWCQGAAKSKKRKKPEGFELPEVAQPTEEIKDPDAPNTFDPADRLAVCEDCDFAFCTRCYQGWHGEFVYCSPRRTDGELTEEEKASLEYVKLHTSPCPTCGCPCSKTHGCNHMICGKCETHFCYLCSSWLAPENPYAHYNQQPGGRVTSCYMRLWELENGDGSDIGHAFHGGRGAMEAEEQELARQPVDPDRLRMRRPANARAPGHGPARLHEQRAAVAREGPLVLRIANLNDPVPVPQANPEVEPAVDRAAQPPGRGRGRGARGHERGRGGRGAAQIVAAPRHAGMDAAQEAWVRQFVQLALDDNEDLVDGW